MPQHRTHLTSHPAFAAVAPWLFVLLWSTGFIGARYGLPYVEPFTFLLIRFIIVITLLLGLALILRVPWPRREQLGHIAVVGLLLHGGYLGGVFYAIDHGMSAGIASLIVSLQPILTAVLAQITLREAVVLRQWIGLLLGFVGAGLVLLEKLIAPGADGVMITIPTLIAIIIALFSTTGGTLYQKRHGGSMPLITGTLVQYIAAGALILIPAFAFEQRVINWTPQLLFALSWLVFVLSLGAILLLMLLIRANSSARVTSLFYLVPPATALEAYFVFGEHFGLMAIAGVILASVGVALVVAGPKQA
ncbi:DMT family transporter [Candidatus Oscillochloris fontis]|uniref:DMT family transporter n=1 Tax=Candidatus Oscillochloris fontis TaxID=2496868 RepID=UPI00101B7B7B|nr:DMT family transporter [Candidatus Oscillochloris fontis]